MRSLLILTALLAFAAGAELPPPPAKLVPYEMSFDSDAPGLLDAGCLLDKPAGRLGRVVARDGHFFAGEKRIRFWGVNICFSACFPTHEQADATARRLARFGVNCVRFHHMDSARFPRGIFAGDQLQTLSPEALDRLDYFIAALKRQGIYTNLNLHVSRTWSRAHGWVNADMLEHFDKMLDIFHPELIAAQKQYARDLLAHVNAYTKTSYADEPGVAMVEITNEDSLFMWGSQQKLAELPEPYDALLKKLWNEWLINKYATRHRLSASWSRNARPLGPNMLRDAKAWNVEQHGDAKMSATWKVHAATLTIQSIDGTDWHLQFNQRGLVVEKGRFYTLRFRASASAPMTIRAALGQAHEPWEVFSSHEIRITTQPQEFSVSFTPSRDETNARISFTVGRQVGSVTLSDLHFATGGQRGLLEGEDPMKHTVAVRGRSAGDSPQRSADWFDFLQSTDEAFFTSMGNYLRDELKVRAPITGTIGMGPLGTLSQSKMDFVDAHAYWDHPQFPRRPWDGNDWLINNKPMVSSPERATLWNLAATRVAGKPFTVTEYNHAAPNDWAAETIPFVAAFAALQDWDGVFLFAYSHSDDFRKPRIASYFDIEGNPTKMPLMPMGARLFLSGAIPPADGSIVVPLDRAKLLADGAAHDHRLWPAVRDAGRFDHADLLRNRLAITFDAAATSRPSSHDSRASWAPARFSLTDPRAAVFVGFADQKPVDLGPLHLKLESPFAAIMLLPAEPGETLAEAKRLLLVAVARAQNTGMKWDDARRSLGTRWGTAPVQIEPVEGTMTSSRPMRLRPLDITGRPDGPESAAVHEWKIGGSPAIAWEITP